MARRSDAVPTGLNVLSPFSVRAAERWEKNMVKACNHAFWLLSSDGDGDDDCCSVSNDDGDGNANGDGLKGAALNVGHETSTLRPTAVLVIVNAITTVGG